MIYERKLVDPMDNNGDVLPPDVSEEPTFQPNLEGCDEFPYVRADEQEQQNIRTITDAERVATVVLGQGLVPASRRELTLALGGVENQGRAGGFAQYLNEVLLHQRKNTTTEGGGVQDPAAALRAITSDIINFANEARGDRTAIENSLESLEDMHALNIIDSSSWQIDQPLRRALRVGLHFSHVHSALEQEPHSNETIDVSTLPTEEDIQQWLATNRVHTIRSLLQDTNEAAASRQKFWQDRLKESMHHTAVKGMAGAALGQLGVNIERR